MSALPVLFVSHGAPNLVLHASPAHDFLQGLGKALPRPRAIVVITAHFMTRAPAVTADAAPETIHDFGGFEPELYQMTYKAPGAPELAADCLAALAEAGIDAQAVSNRGFDHGTWVPLMLMYPKADIPVVQLSVQPKAGPEHHLKLGMALRRLGEQGILVIGSGALTHNLGEVFGGTYGFADPAPAWVQDFGEWMCEHVEAGDTAALLDYRARAPHAVRNHPTEEHLLPLFSAIGAADGRPGRRLHSSAQYGVLMMDVFGFGMAA
ncbi:MAG TPA: class III extradiol ring-cleavage dioxygenase [Beijerinckiaceae bacterium]|nr:class III extradiol ring-cleavage dioxygenase [Beijerinckiaceae bacterium]